MNEILNENIIFSSKDIDYRLDDFKNNKVKILFVTGFSGSGKTTVANKLEAEIKDAVKIEYDDICYHTRFTDEQLKEYDPIIYDFFTKNSLGKYLRESKQDAISKLTCRFCAEFAKYVDTHAIHRYILEGIQIYLSVATNSLPTSLLKKNALIIKGTPFLKSTYRASKRDIKNSKQCGETRLQNLKNNAKNVLYKLSFALDDNKDIESLKSKFK